MKVLVACEESQRVCIEFRKLGHEAYSCDIEPCSGGHLEWHIQADVLPLLNGNCEFQTVDGDVHRIDRKWDMIIAFPPCTYLTVAGNRWFDVEKYGDKAIERERNREQGKQFFMRFVNANCDKIAIENPIGIMNTAYRKPDCIIQPWQFGHNASKSTCLWLKNLDALKPTDIIQDERKRKENQQISADGKLLGFMTRDSNGKIMRYNDPETAKIRSKTFLGIAKAMAEQWGNIEIKSEATPSKSMKCSELKPNDTVAFYVTVYAGGEEEVYDGNVIYVDKDRKSVCVCYLEGYKSRSDIIPFEKMIAKADENGEEMLFCGWIRGKSVLLSAE